MPSPNAFPMLPVPIPANTGRRRRLGEAASDGGMVNMAAVAIGLISAGVVLGPLAVGATRAPAPLLLDIVIAAAVVLWVGAGRRPVGLLLLPVAVAGLAVVQLLPLPDSVLGSLAPIAAPAWKLAHQGIPDVSGSVSVYPEATAAGLRQLLLGLSLIVMVADLSRDARHRQWLLWSLAGVGLLIWMLGLIFPGLGAGVHEKLVMGCVDLTGPVEYWKSPLDLPGQTAGVGESSWEQVGELRYVLDSWIAGDCVGPYVLSNHFAAGLYLTIPILLALGLQFSRDKLPTAARYALLVVLLALVVWTVGIMAKSRAGGAAMLLAAFVVVALSVENRLARWLTGGAAMAFACALALYFALFFGILPGSEMVLPASMESAAGGVLHNSRQAAAHVAIRMFLSSPLLGTGLGTFGHLFPRFVRGSVPWGFAHNDYAQLFSETGLVGAAVALFLAIPLGVRFYRCCVSATAADRMADAGIWAGLAGLVMHSAFDWNLHVPANAFLACVVVGLALGGVSGRRKGGLPQPGPLQPGPLQQAAAIGPQWAPVAAATMLAASCIAATLWSARDTVSAATAREVRVALVGMRGAKTVDQRAAAALRLTSAASAAQRMIEWDRGNSDLDVLAGQAYLHLAATEESQQRSEHLSTAEELFREARRHSAVCRGLPEPVPPPAAQAQSKP